MKNKHLRYCTVFFVLIFLLFCACSGKTKSYPFFNDVSEISNVKIVKVSNSLSYEELKIITILIIEAKEQFLEEFLRIKGSYVFGYAYAVNESEPHNQYVEAIKFEYTNGDWELLAVHSPGRSIYSVEEYWGGDDTLYNGDEHYNAFAGTFSLDSKQLKDLVEKYLEKAE